MQGVVDRDSYGGIVDVFGEPIDLLTPLAGYYPTAQNTAMLGGWSDSNGPTEITTTGTKPNPRGCILAMRVGYSAKDQTTESLVTPIAAGTSSMTVMGALGARFALVKRDAPWEIDSSRKGVPNGELIATTGSAITWNTARTNWSTTQSQYARFPWSGGDVFIARGTPLALFMAFEVAYTATTSPDVPEENIWPTTSHDMPYHRGARLAAAADRLGGRPAIFNHDLVAGGIDNINWLGNIAGASSVQVPIINWSAYSDAQMHGNTHWNCGPSVTTVGAATTTWSTVTGKFLYCAPMWGAYYFCPADGPY